MEHSDKNSEAEWGEDEDPLYSLELYWELIKESRLRQGKTAQLTPDEQNLTREECDLLLRHEQEAESAFNETKAHEKYTKRIQFGFRLNVSLVAIGLSFWFLSNADWLPWGIAGLLAGISDTVAGTTNPTLRGFAYLLPAGMGLAYAPFSFLELRALRLGTERARKQADAAEMVAGWLLVGGGVVVFGTLLGFFVYAWLDGYFSNTPYLLFSFLGLTILYFLLGNWAFEWAEARTKRAGLPFVLMSFGALITAHGASLLHYAWQWPNDNLSLKTHNLFWATLWALPLLWVITIAVRRLRERAQTHL